MIDTQSLKYSIDRLAIINGMINELSKDKLDAKGNSLKNMLVDKMIQEAVILNNILGSK